MNILTKVKKILGKDEEEIIDCKQEESYESTVKEIDIKELREITKTNRNEMMGRYYEYYKNKIEKCILESADEGNFSTEIVFDYDTYIKGNKIEVDKNSCKNINEQIDRMVPVLVEYGFRVNVSKENNGTILYIDWELKDEEIEEAN